MKRVVFYVDGYNFYYGIRKIAAHKPEWRRFYWIDLVKLFSGFLAEDEELAAVNYFTARPKNKGKAERQDRLMGCNKSLHPDLFKIHYGKYREKTMVCHAPDGCGKTFTHWEEKQTDVNLALKMIEDCHHQACDKIVLVSGDSDFLPPLRLIHTMYTAIDAMILFPPGKFTRAIDNLDLPVLSMGKFRSRWSKAELPASVHAAGKTFRIPQKWKSGKQYDRRPAG